MLTEGLFPKGFSDEKYLRLRDEKQSPSQKSKIFASPLYTRGAFTQLADRTYALTRYARNKGLYP